MSKTKSKRRKRKAKAGRVTIQQRGVAAGTAAPWGDRPGRHPVVPLENGETGYGMSPGRTDDCFQAAIATALQVPIEQVPDLRLDKRLAAGDDRDEIDRQSWLRLAEWLGRLGLWMTFHEDPPFQRERWVGVVFGRDRLVGAPVPGAPAGVVWRDNPFTDHCLVMARNTIAFDPAVTQRLHPGVRPFPWQAHDVDYGITFDRMED